jgi:ornithine cyclodeaminase/alanine dehydrogenase-like protein (mu-crystallin family)
MLFIDNETVERVLTMKDCIEVQEQAFQQSLSGQSMQRGRLDFYAPCDRDDGYYRWGTMEGVSHGVLAIRMKSDIVTWPEDETGKVTEDKYCVEPGTYCGLIFLLSTGNGEPLAIINDGYIQHMRVGGGAGIGVKHLSRENSSMVGMLGSGGMARTFLEAFLVVRPIETVKVYSPTRDHREQFAREMSEKHNINVIAVDTPEEAARSVDILSTCTDSMTPTVKPEWLEPGMHLANLGPAEIDASVMARVDRVIRQGTSGLRVVKNDRVVVGVGHSPVAFVAGTDEEVKRLPERTPPIAGFKADSANYGDLISGKVAGRTSDDQITFYHNMGNQGLQFSAVGSVVYEQAKQQKLGRELPTEWFLQDIRD